MDDSHVPADLLILDRQILFCHGLVALLRSAHPDWRCAVAHSLSELQTRLVASRSAIVVIDLQFPELDGFIGIAALHRQNAEHRIVILSDNDDRASVLSGLTSGARGFISRAANPMQFLRAIETIEAGGVFAPASLTGAALAEQAITPPLPSDQYRLADLTDRQRDVFLLLAEGCPTKTIARRLNLAVGTVKVHLAAIYRLLGASGRMEAIAKAHRAFAA